MFYDSFSQVIMVSRVSSSKVPFKLLPVTLLSSATVREGLRCGHTLKPVAKKEALGLGWPGGGAVWELQHGAGQRGACFSPPSHRAANLMAREAAPWTRLDLGFLSLTSSSAYAR